MSQTTYLFPSLRGNRPYSKFFWSVFSRIWTEYGEILRILPYLVRMLENTVQETLNTGTFHAVLTPLLSKGIEKIVHEQPTKFLTL